MLDITDFIRAITNEHGIYQRNYTDVGRLKLSLNGGNCVQRWRRNGSLKEFWKFRCRSVPKSHRETLREIHSELTPVWDGNPTQTAVNEHRNGLVPNTRPISQLIYRTGPNAREKEESSWEDATHSFHCPGAVRLGIANSDSSTFGWFIGFESTTDDWTQ